MSVTPLCEPVELLTSPAREVGAGQRRSGIIAVLRDAGRMTRTRIGLILVGVVVLIAFGGPLIAAHDPTDFVGAPFEQDPDGSPLGADVLGRDVLARFMHGGRTLLLLAGSATLLGVAAGVSLGVVAAYSRSAIDELIMRSLDVVLSFPQIVLGLLVLSLVGPNFWLIAAVVAVVQAPQVARVARSAALGVRAREYVQFCEAIGVPRWKIMLSEIVPNISSPVLVEFGFRLTFGIGLIAALSFLGLGVRPPDADWGLMINENRVGLLQAPWGVLAPVAAIAVLTVGANLIADGLARAAIGIDRRAQA